MLYVYSFCDGSATAVEEYRRLFPIRRIPDSGVFSRVFNALRECVPLPSAHVSSEGAQQQQQQQQQQYVEEQENILDMVQLSPTTGTRRICTRLGVSRTSVW
jgi:tRNA A37 threonylcarbamoyladenosine synthetase subunit TsaC/SUA5/YrdC